MTRSARGRRFTYVGWLVRPDGELDCTYEVDGERFVETFRFQVSDRWDSPATDAAARLLFLASGVSYYKTAAPAIIDLGSTPIGLATRRWLREYYVKGLAEFAYRNNLDLSDLQIVGGLPAVGPLRYAGDASRPLIPFGGGIDSIVTVESIRQKYSEAALFVVNRPADRFAAIERPAKVTELPIRRAERSIDPKVLESTSRGYYNGHVPVTGIISAAAVLAAVLDGRGVVVMSNEWSSSAGTLVADGREVNHQYSKSFTFERSFRAALAEGLGDGLAYFSAIRPFSELWIAQRFADLVEYHSEFRSCNRAFHIDPALRMEHWCGVCDKCCFIDLILAPYVAERELDVIFGGREPLRQPKLIDQFRTLVGMGGMDKPFECVGDVDESSAAVQLAAAREDRRGSVVLDQLAREIDSSGAQVDVDRLLRPMGEHFVPQAYAIDS